jgi:hypothetical protein
MTPRLRSTSAILAAFAVPLVVYVASLRGDVSFWDTGDLQTVPYILGIPYPTGFPGFVLVGWLWTHAIPVGAVAWRMNLLTAVASAGTVAALVALLLTAEITAGVALAAAALFAFANLPWDHATYVDVHPVSFCVVAWASVFALRWQRAGRPADAAAVLAGVVTGLAFDNTTVLLLPGLLLLSLVRRPPLGATLRGLAIAALVLVAVYAYLPLRSAQVTALRLDPTLQLGIPPGRPFWDDGHPATLAGFVHVVAGARFAPHHALFAMLGSTAVGRVLSDFGPRAERDLGAPVLWLALFGGALWWWRAPLVLGALVLFAIVPLLFIFAYPSESDTGRYFLAGYFGLAALAAYGAQALGALPTAPRVAASLVGLVLVVAVLAADVRQTSSLFRQPTDPGASEWISRVRLLTPPNAVVVAPWLYATSLGYGAYVEHVLGDRIIVTADPKEYVGKYRDWLRARPVVVVSDGDETFGGFTQRVLDVGSPHLYALR